MTMTRPNQEQTGAPRWVKVSAIAGGVVALLFVVMLVSGHGPGRHLQGMAAMPVPAAIAAPANQPTLPGGN
jgi:hypothetical protein